jgi:acyl-coenzyme A synthetase/AMP-(fatty) acid ligase
MLAPARGRALVHGPPLVLPADVPTDVRAAIAARISAWPHGTIQSYNHAGKGSVASYQDLWRRAATIAAALRRFDTRDCTRVVLLIDDVVDFVAAFWGCVRGGFTVVSLMSAVRDAYQPGNPDSRENPLGKVGGGIVLADGRFMEAASMLGKKNDLLVLSLAEAEREPAEQFEDVSPADPPYLLPTSGSTGNLKLVAVSQSAALYRTFALPPKTEHRWLGTFPLDGITGQNCALVPYGSWTQIGADAFAANPLSVLDAIQELRVTGLTLTPSAARRVIAAPAHSGRTWDLGSLRQLGLGGETVAYVLAENLARFLSAHGASPSVIRAGYGTTETGYLVQGANPIASPQVDAPSLGACAPGASLRVVGTDGEILAEGEIGELQVSRPQTMFSSYWGDPGCNPSMFYG